MAEVPLHHFLEACRAYVHESERDALGPDTFVWRDLSLAGDDWWEFSVGILRYLQMDYEPDRVTGFDIHDYIPTESEALWVHWGLGKRSLPDIKLREIYAFVRDGFVRKADGK